MGSPDYKTIFGITFNWPSSLKISYAKTNDSRFAMKWRYVGTTSHSDWHTLRSNIKFTFTSWVWFASAWSDQINWTRNCSATSTAPENCTWCPLRSMKNTSFDSAPSRRMPTRTILVQTCKNGVMQSEFWYSFGSCFSIHLETAWDIITDFATELLEKEQADEITEILDRKRKETLAQKRSFFVRMVSDPKIYNPAINKAGSTPRMSTDNYSPIVEGAPTIQTPRRYKILRADTPFHGVRRIGPQAWSNPMNTLLNITALFLNSDATTSWISWPLAFLFANSEDGPKSNVPIR